jgi:hypothetical protein
LYVKVGLESIKEKDHYLHLTPNSVMVVWLKSLLHILEVPGSNIVLEAGSPEVFVVFLSISRQILG